MIVGKYPPLISGIGDYTERLAQEFVKLKHQVTVVTSEVDYKDGYLLSDGVDVRRIISGWRMSEIKRILNIIDEMGPDTLVHIQYGCPMNRRRPMINLLPILLRLLRREITIVLTLHEFRQQRLRWRIRASLMIFAAQGLIFVDPLDRRFLQRLTRLSKTKIKCIPIAPSIQPIPATKYKRQVWRKNLGLDEKNPIIVYFGGITPQKGFLDLLVAVSKLRGESLPVKLLVIGAFEPYIKYHVRYENMARKALGDGIKDGWVILVDKSPPDVVSSCFHASDVAAFPFTNGARSNRGSLLTAIAHGLPVVTTRGVETQKGFDEQYGVELVPARDVKALSLCLKSIILSEEKKKALKSKALKAAKQFSWASIAYITLEFYNSLIINHK